MGLRTSATSANMVISEEANVSWARERLVVYPPSIYGFKYTRRRTMRYSYVGLTKAAAKSIAQQIENWLVRRTAPQTWNHSYWRYDVPTVTVENPEGVVMIDAISLAKLDAVVGGHAVPQQVAGESWAVNVEIDETLDYLHPPSQTDHERPPVWAAFERNPEIETPNFKRHTDGVVGGGEIDFPLFKDWSAA